MKSSPTTGKIDAAMAAVQLALVPVAKNKGVEVDGAKAKWESRFTTFEALWAACKDPLAVNGVSVTQGGEFVPGAGERLVTRLSCEGEWIESSFPIKTSRDGAQGFGGGISFAKRWGLAAMVGIVSTDDADERTGYQNERTPAKVRQKAPPALGAALAAIRSANSSESLTAAAGAARADFAREPEVERTIAAWFVDELSRVSHPDALILIRDLGKAIKPRGGDVLSALQAAETRLVGGK